MRPRTRARARTTVGVPRPRRRGGTYVPAAYDIDIRDTTMSFRNCQSVSLSGVCMKCILISVLDSVPILLAIL
eukprot:COSAG02_NODE_2325_length_9132_cov_16.589752_7_plen_73_part_00